MKLSKVEEQQSKVIKVIGSFLFYYESDLKHIKAFQEYVHREVRTNNMDRTYLSQFISFLQEFRVLRNIRRGGAEDVLRTSVNYVKKEEPSKLCPNVLSEILGEYTYNKKAVSLSSKILFLYEPERFVPLDSLNKSTLGLSENNYDNFLERFRSYFEKEENLFPVKVCMEKTQHYAFLLEKKVQLNFDPMTIRSQRIKDKFLRGR